MRLASRRRRWRCRVGVRHRLCRILGGVGVCLRRLKCRDLLGWVWWLMFAWSPLSLILWVAIAFGCTRVRSRFMLGFHTT